MDSTTICNMALAEIGTRSKITSLTDGSSEANVCNLYYTSVRDQALRAARWNFAKHVDTVTLWKALPGTPENPTPATLTGWQRTYPPPPWLYSYALPTDFLYARCVIPQPDISTLSPPLYPVAGTMLSLPRVMRVPFGVSIDHYDTSGNVQTPQKKVFSTNAQVPLLEYTYQCTDENLFDSEFVMTMALAMAARLAIALMSDKAMAQLKAQTANEYIANTRAMDGNEGLTVLDHTPDWLRIRGVSSQYYNPDFWYPYGPLFTMGAYA
jgi:hypothetical protein